MRRVLGVVLLLGCGSFAQIINSSGSGLPAGTIVADAQSPYTPTSSDVNIVCNGSAANVTINLAAASGSKQQLRIANVSSTRTCIIHPNGTDTVFGFNANYTLNPQFYSASLLDRASGTWDVIDSPSGLNNKGDSIQPSADVPIGINSPPAQPTLTAQAGSTLPIGTYQVKTTYSNANGQTLGSTTQTITTVGATQTIKVTSPAAQAGMTQYHAYFTQAGGTCSGATCWDQSGAVNIGTDYTQSAIINTGTQNPPTINTADTLVFSDFAPAPTSGNSFDMCGFGLIEFTYSGTGNGTVWIKMSLWNNNNPNPATAIDAFVVQGQSPFVVPIMGCAFLTNVHTGTSYFGSVYAATTLTGVVAKFKDTSGNYNSTYWNLQINPTY